MGRSLFCCLWVLGGPCRAAVQAGLGLGCFGRQVSYGRKRLAEGWAEALYMPDPLVARRQKSSEDDSREK